MTTLTAEVLVAEKQGRFGDELYGVYELLAVESAAEAETVAIKIHDHEAAHVAEGIRLVQRRSIEFHFDGHRVLDLYSNEAMVDIAERAIEVTGDNPELQDRMRHDSHTGHRANELMKEGQVGDGFWRVSPYGHEWDDDTAREAGMWPERKRSYLELYRKADEQTLEFTTVTIDNSQLSAYRHLLTKHGQTVSTAALSHDFPSFIMELTDLVDVAARDEWISQTVDDYYAHLDEDGIEQPNQNLLADDFIDQHAHAINKIVQLNLELKDSVLQGRLTPFASEAVREAWQLCKDLQRDEQVLLTELIDSQQIDLNRNGEALRLLLNIQRYGVWQYLRERLDGDADQQELTPADILYYARRAAIAAQVMPGCTGGFGLDAMYNSIWGSEGWHGGEIKHGYCVNCKEGPRPVGRESWCQECITGHCF